MSEDYDLVNKKYQVTTSRRNGLPSVVLDVKRMTDRDGKPLSDMDKLLVALEYTAIDLTPEDAIGLGESLISLGKDCQNYPDLRFDHIIECLVKGNELPKG